jgi:aspartate aminotransferase
MPSISQKGQAMPESPIRKLVPFAEAAKKSGKKVLHLNIGQPDIATPECALEAVRKFDEKVIEYSHSAGFESYRNGLAAYYQKVGVPVQGKDIMITTGGSESLLFGFMSCLDAGDEVIIPEPYYANYNGFAIAAGVVVKPVMSSIDTGFALPPIQAFEEMITPRTKAILICNPGNPTGYLYSKQELETLREIVLKHDLFLFADEVYREFCYDGHVHNSVMNLEGLDNHVIMVDSVSKRYSMCGTRIGALVSRNPQVMQTALKFAQARLSPPTLGQVAAEAALQTPQQYFDDVVAEYVQRRDILVDGLNAIPGVLCPKPKGAFYAMARLPVDDAEAFCKWMLEHFEYQGETVMMAPANGFYSHPDKGRDEVRLAYVLNQDALKRAVVCLQKALEVYPGSKIALQATTGAGN